MISVGVIGYGSRMSSLIRKVFREVTRDFHIVGIIDPDEKGARDRLDPNELEHVVFYSSLDEMVRKGKLDAIMIGTRCNLHAEYAVQASKYNLPLFLEKPVAISMKQATELERAFEKSACQVLVSLPLRVSPLCEITQTFIQGGSIGSPEHIMSFNYVPYGTMYWEKEYRNFSITQGLFIQKATHDFDYMIYLMGSPIVRVAAMANYGRIFGGDKPSGLVCSRCDEATTCLESPQNRTRNSTTGSKDDHPCVFSIECGSPDSGMNEDCSSALVQFSSGAHGTYTQVFFSRRDAASRGSRISGYRGTLSFDWYKNKLTYVRHHAPFSDTVRANEGKSHFGGDYELAVNFVGMIEGRPKSNADIWAGLQSVYTCLAAKKSLETGKFVSVRQVGQS